MFTVALISRKGGAGKTTLACGLAVAGERKGLTTALVDLDPQGSASARRALICPIPSLPAGINEDVSDPMGPSRGMPHPTATKGRMTPLFLGGSLTS